MITFLDTFILGIALTLPLGPVTLEILHRGLKQGMPESLKTVAGAFSAELTYFVLVYFGLSQIAQNSITNIILGVLGVAFMLYLAQGNFKDFLKPSIGKTALQKNAFAAGYFITFLNPANFFMWVGIIGGFFAQTTEFFIHTGVLLGIILSLLTIAAVGVVGKKTIKEHHMKYVSLAAALFLFYYGLKLGYDVILKTI